MDTPSVLRSLSLFIVAGVCEIGGGWLLIGPGIFSLDGLLFAKWLSEAAPGRS